MRHALLAACAVALLPTLLTGCSGDRREDTATAVPSSTLAASWGTDPKPAAGAVKLGGGRSPCALPVTFTIATSWKASSVPDGLASQGGFTLRCEVDAKPAGHAGFLRVWVRSAGDDDPAAALDGFLTGQPGVLGRQSRVATAGALPAAEATYLTDNQELGARRQERLLAVGTGTGTVILSLGGLTLDEHRALLPAYVLARQTLAAAS
jgi:hypothetical protein